MSVTWQGDAPSYPPRGAMGRLRAAGRGAALCAVLLGGFPVLLVLRGIERPICGLARPWSAPFVSRVLRAALACAGLSLRQSGPRMRGSGAIVANHVSWLDIFALAGQDELFFVSKSEVRRWPVVGTLAAAAGTLFIDRDPRAAGRQRDLLSRRLAAGHRLAFFPEGTSTDGQRVLTFKSSLFGAFYRDDLPGDFEIQPVTLVYAAPPGCDPRFYGWWGDMNFAAHLARVLAAPRGGAVEVRRHAPVAVRGGGDRKALAKRTEEMVRSGLPPQPTDAA